MEHGTKRQTDSDYVLGTDAVELERLHLQNQLWSDAAHALWRLARIGPRSQVLDLGCGPGAASLDLAQLVTSSGKVVAVDESPAFVAHVERAAKERALPQLVAKKWDVQDIGALPGVTRASFDAAYARWVLCFTPNPAAVVAGAAQLLRPGGAFLVHDYFNYEFMTAAPRRASYDRMVRTTARSWRDAGADPDVVGRLPRILDEAGFELVHLTVHQRLARPGDTMWHWATSWWRSYGPKLVARGAISPDELAEFERDEAAMTRNHDFLVLPPVFEVMARRR
jgi:SAM-dependent methyltransferase